MYLIIGMILWYFVFISGIHATISGVLLAAVIPSKKDENGECLAYKLEHKLQEGNNLWFFMKDIKTGKDVDLNDIKPKLFVTKNEGDIVSITDKRYKVYPKQYDESIRPMYNKFSWPWWWLFWFPILCIGILFMFSEESGSFNYYGDYYLENKLGRKPTELEIKLNKLLMGIWEIFVWSAPIISLISTLIFLIICN